MKCNENYEKLGGYKQNFVLKSSSNWDALIDKIRDKCSPNLNGVMVPGSTAGSDLSASIAIVKNRLKCFLIEIQKQDPILQLGWSKSYEWYPDNFF